MGGICAKNPFHNTIQSKADEEAADSLRLNEAANLMEKGDSKSLVGEAKRESDEVGNVVDDVRKDDCQESVLLLSPCEANGDIANTIFSYEAAIRAMTISMNEYGEARLSITIQEYRDRIQELLQDNLKLKLPAPRGDSEKNWMVERLAGSLVRAKSGVTFTNIAGLDDAKKQLKRATKLPFLLPQLYQGNRKPPSTILLFGPAGTGKSMLAKALTSEAKVFKFFKIYHCDIQGRHRGQSEKLVKTLFHIASLNVPAIIFIDDVDLLMQERSSSEFSDCLAYEFLAQLSEMKKGVVFIGTTRHPRAMDSAFYRSFQRRVFINLPPEATRRSTFRMNLDGLAHSLSDEQFATLAARTEGYSGRDITELVECASSMPYAELQERQYFKHDAQGLFVACKESDAGAMRLNWLEEDDCQFCCPPITQEHMMKALELTPKTTSAEELKECEEFAREFGNCCESAVLRSV